MSCFPWEEKNTQGKGWCFVTLLIHSWLPGRCGNSVSSFLVNGTEDCAWEFIVGYFCSHFPFILDKGLIAKQVYVFYTYKRCTGDKQVKQGRKHPQITIAFSQIHKVDKLQADSHHCLQIRNWLLKPYLKCVCIMTLVPTLAYVASCIHICIPKYIGT